MKIIHHFFKENPNRLLFVLFKEKSTRLRFKTKDISNIL